MKMIKIIPVAALILLLLSCGTSQKIRKPNLVLDQMIEQKSFKIAVRIVEPFVTQAWSQVANSGLLQQGNTVGRIDVTAQGFYVEVKGDSVSAKLPFYGERQLGGGYNTTGPGIEFNGVASDLKHSKNGLRYSHELRFTIREKTETYQVQIIVHPDLTSRIRINSLQRSFINYRGKISEDEAADTARL